MMAPIAGRRLISRLAACERRTPPGDGDEFDEPTRDEAPVPNDPRFDLSIGIVGDWPDSDRFIAGATRGFVVLGLILRAARYFADLPLLSDEARLAANFVHGGFGDIVGPLRYQQIAPIGYLAVEVAAVRIFGFSTWSLRLFAFCCSLASVLLFRHVAGKLLRGLPLLLSVAFFSAAWWPIAFAAEIKPYASDLLISLVLLSLALGWLRAPGRAGWLWGLAGAASLAATLSFPAIFVTGGLILALAPIVWRQRGPRIAIPFFIFAILPPAIFAALLPSYTLSPEVRAYMERYWADAYPPREGSIRLLAWLIQIHTGNLFAYPAGCESGGSIITAAGFFAGAFALWHRRQYALLAMGLAPLALNLGAAIPHRYPYGDQARTMQYAAPIVCLFAGLGLATIIGRISRAAIRRRTSEALLLACAAVGLANVAYVCVHPYDVWRDRRLREFARQFWAEIARDAEALCAECHLGVVAWPRQWEVGNWTHYFECYERIYSPCCRNPHPLEGPADGRPLRVVFFNERPEHHPQSREWLEIMGRGRGVQSVRSFTLRLPERRAPEMVSRYLVYEFAPRMGPIPSSVAGATRTGAKAMFAPGSIHRRPATGLEHE